MPGALRAQPECITMPASLDRQTRLGSAKGTCKFRVAYSTRLGTMLEGVAENLAEPAFLETYRGRIHLILTSPPFPLNTKKEYGNLQGRQYVDWIARFAPLFKALLSPRGSIVIEIGNAWEPGRPTMSPLALEALLQFLHKGRLHLCQQFIAYNYAKIPGPAEWVTIRRIRVKDAFTNIWWMSQTEYPRSDNRKVLNPYTSAMLDLLRTKRQAKRERPSGHKIGHASFLKDNGGSIPSNVLEFANTNSKDDYLEYCRLHSLQAHPARMAQSIAAFFLKFLTSPGSLVLDPFAGSNVTGQAAEKLGRKWLAVEPNQSYIESSRGRFPSL